MFTSKTRVITRPGLLIMFLWKINVEHCDQTLYGSVLLSLYAEKNTSIGQSEKNWNHSGNEIILRKRRWKGIIGDLEMTHCASFSKAFLFQCINNLTWQTERKTSRQIDRPMDKARLSWSISRPQILRILVLLSSTFSFLHNKTVTLKTTLLLSSRLSLG